uniref:Apyrase n=1 Tax=Anopheles atroparvus TaxID=41427 RepID=A0AAG5DND9_ANOAO
MGKVFLLRAIVLCLVLLQCSATDFLPTDRGQLHELYPLTIIHINDLHARFHETSERSGKCDGEGCIAGIARVFQTVQDLRKAHKNALFLNAGDNFQGTIWYNYHRWKVVAHTMKLLRPDAMTLGNHEFDDTLDGLKPYLQALAKANITTVVANLDSSQEEKFPRLPPTTIIERGSRKIGIIGVIYDQTHQLSKTGAITFADSVATVRHEAEKLKKTGVHIIVVLSHCGLEIDKRIAREAGDHVDVIVGGHSHSFLFPESSDKARYKDDKVQGDYPLVVSNDNGRKILIVQAYAYGKYVGRLTAYFNTEGEIQYWEGFPIYMSHGVTQNGQALRTLEPFRKAVDKFASKRIAKTTIDLVQSTCRVQECNLGSLVADSLADYYTNDSFHPVAVINAGEIRSPISKGEITNEEAIGASPFSNTADLLTLRGDALWNIIEHSLVLDAVKRTNTAQVAGLRIVADLGREPYHRVISLEVRDLHDGTTYRPLNRSANYKVAMKSFIASGKDGFRWALERLDRQIGPLDSDVFISYLKKLKVVNEANLVSGRFNITGQLKSQ